MEGIKELGDGWYKAKFLLFKDEGLLAPGKKTKKFSVTARKSKVLLGYVRWMPKWRQYCFYTNNVILDRQCLKDLHLFCEGMTLDHRAKIKAHLEANKDKYARKREIKRRRDHYGFYSDRKAVSIVVPDWVEASQDTEGVAST